jgi:cell division control protein 6
LENLPSPPTTPKRKTKVVVAITPTPIRNITKELELAKCKINKREAATIK